MLDAPAGVYARPGFLLTRENCRPAKASSAKWNVLFGQLPLLRICQMNQKRGLGRPLLFVDSSVGFGLEEVVIFII